MMHRAFAALFLAGCAAAPADTNKVLLVGDSYGSIVHEPLENALDAAVTNISVGGSTAQQQVGFILKRGPTKCQVVVFWDGDANEYGSVSAYLGYVDEIIRLAGGPARLVALAPLKREKSLAENKDRQIIADAMRKRVGANFIDAQAILAKHAGDSEFDKQALAGGYVPRSLMNDDYHLTPRGYEIVAAEIAARVKDLRVPACP